MAVRRGKADKVDEVITDNKIGEVAEVNEVDKVKVDKFDEVSRKCRQV